MDNQVRHRRYQGEEDLHSQSYRTSRVTLENAKEELSNYQIVECYKEYHDTRKGQIRLDDALE